MDVETMSYAYWKYLRDSYLYFSFLFIRTLSSKRETRILVVLSDGISHNYMGKSGFMLSRKQSLIMRREGLLT